MSRPVTKPFKPAVRDLLEHEDDYECRKARERTSSLPSKRVPYDPRGLDAWRGCSRPPTNTVVVGRIGSRGDSRIYMKVLLIFQLSNENDVENLTE
jgi:hypothetical protein